jgi:hypothetical protein
LETVEVRCTASLTIQKSNRATLVDAIEDMANLGSARAKHDSSRAIASLAGAQM